MTYDPFPLWIYVSVCPSMQVSADTSGNHGLEVGDSFLSSSLLHHSLPESFEAQLHLSPPILKSNANLARE